MENLKMLNKFINDPKNYVAIYARISSQKENNSINAQIKLAEEIVAKKNLLVYSSYTDKVSGKTTAPKERKGFGKLLEDAKAGCFKTLVIYRLDRLVRRYDDWIETKKMLNKLGVKILFSDESQPLMDDSAQSEFFQNFSVMVAEMEPDTISLRATEGRNFRRKNGAYTSPNNPFGYRKEESKDKKKSKSIFIQEPIKLSFIKYIFLLINSFIIKEKNNCNSEKISFLGTIYASLETVMNHIETNIYKGSIPLKEDNIQILYENELYTLINKYINAQGIEFVSNQIQEVKFHFLFDEKTDKKRNTNNISTCLKNNIYAGLMLIDSNHPYKGLVYFTTDDNNTIYKERLDTDAFISTNNLKGVVPLNVFNTVYSYLTYEELSRIDRTPNFLLKGALRCSCCNKKLKLIEDNYVYCGSPKCYPFLKYDLLEFILDKVIDNCLSKSQTPFQKFINKLSRKVEINSQNIKYHTFNKFEAVSNYLTLKDSSYIDDIYQKNESIKSYTDLCSKYRSKLSYLNQLCDEVNNINQKNTTSEDAIEDNKSLLLESKKKIVNHILNNEDFFIPIFNEIIKEIKVAINYDQSPIKGKLNIKYEFKA